MVLLLREKGGLFLERFVGPAKMGLDIQKEKRFERFLSLERRDNGVEP